MTFEFKNISIFEKNLIPSKPATQSHPPRGNPIVLPTLGFQMTEFSLVKMPV